MCELRREHPRWGPLQLVHELGRAGVTPVSSRMSVYRVLVRHGLIEPQLACSALTPSRWRAGADQHANSGRLDLPCGVPERRLDQRVLEGSVTSPENTSSEAVCEFWHGTS